MGPPRKIEAALPAWVEIQDEPGPGVGAGPPFGISNHEGKKKKNYSE